MNNPIEVAEKLMTTKSTAGFAEIFKISAELAEKATDDCFNFPGWDQQQIACRVAAAQAAREFHQQLWKIIGDKIDAGQAAYRDQKVAEMASRTMQQSVEEADQLRREALNLMDEDGIFAVAGDQRISGSY